jgi:hypothetical protein
MASVSRAMTRSFLVLVLACGVVVPPAVARAQAAVVVDHDPTALVVFREELAPYGTWVQHPRYGTVWVPSAAVVGADFAPYVTSGHWALAEDGDWMWVSDYPFGWAVFHYGRWVWSSDYGWVWVPGRQYSHAWVIWRVPAPGYAYVGWAPAPPSFVWVDGYAGSVWYRPVVPYVFCDSRWVFHTRAPIRRSRPRRVVHLAAGTRRYVSPIDARRRGPTLAEARVSYRYAPASRTAADPRALASRERPGVPPSGSPRARARQAPWSIDRAPSRWGGAPLLRGAECPGRGCPPFARAAPAGGRRCAGSRRPRFDARCRYRLPPPPSPAPPRGGTAAPSPRVADGAGPTRSSDGARPTHDRAASAPASRSTGGRRSLVPRRRPPPLGGPVAPRPVPRRERRGADSGSRSGATPSARPSRR